MSWTTAAAAWVNVAALGGRGMSELPPSDRLLPYPPWAAQLPSRAGPFRTPRQVLTAGGLEQPAFDGYNTSNVKRGDTHQWRTWN